jgi:hypothetical protein
VNREEELNRRFPYKDGTTYIQSIDRFNSIGIDNTDSTDSIDRVDSIDDRDESGVDSVNVAATKPPQPTAPPILFSFKSIYIRRLNKQRIWSKD